MVQKKSKKSFVAPVPVEDIDMNEESTEEVVKPIIKKSKKRKSAQVSDNVNGSDRVPVEDLDRNEDSTEEVVKPTIKKSKKRKSAQNGAGAQTGDAVSDHANGSVCNEEKETGEKPSPAKKVKKEHLPAEKVHQAKTSTVDDNKPNDPKTQEEMKELGASYLKTWEESRRQWRFKARIQKWLALNILNVSCVPEKEFTILLEYISGGKEKFREQVVRKASVAFEGLETDKVKLARAHQIIKSIKIRDSSA